MADNRTRTYNTVTAVVLAVTLVVCLVVVFLVATSSGQTRLNAEPTLIDPSAVTQTVAAPTANPTSTGAAAAEVIATLTLTPTTPPPSQTPTPTDTPEPTETEAPEATETPEPTEEDEPTETATRAATRASTTTTPTATLTETTTAGTSSEYEYILRDDEIEYVSNFANDAGCDWMGVAGQVFNAASEPVTGLYVHVMDGESFDIRVKSGDTPAYGDSGWEVYLDDHPVERTYTVQLELEDGEQISEAVSVQTTDSCDMNLVLLVFEQAS